MSTIKDNYLTIASTSYGEYKEKGSKFMAFAYPMDDEHILSVSLESLRSEHHKARHFCYAYQIGLDQNRFRINDDGEPSGTAGKPIYGQIQSYGLTNILVVVVRYFGGTKLGVSGLIHAYKEATKAALDESVIIEKYISNTYQLRFNYDQMGHVLNVLKDLNIEITDKIFEAACTVNISLRQSIEIATLHKMIARLLNKSTEEVTHKTKVDFCEIIRVL